jgi:hypothetical protein
MPALRVADVQPVAADQHEDHLALRQRLSEIDADLDLVVAKDLLAPKGLCEFVY